MSEVDTEKHVRHCFTLLYAIKHQDIEAVKAYNELMPNVFDADIHLAEAYKTNNKDIISTAVAARFKRVRDFDWTPDPSPF